MFRALLGATDSAFSVVHLASAVNLGGTLESTDDHVSMPAEQESGDLAIYAEWAFSGGSSPTPAVPTGFTLVDSATGTDGSNHWAIVIGYKVMASDDGAVELTGMSYGGASYSFVGVYRPRNGTIGSVAVTTGGAAEITTGNPAAQSLVLGSTAKPVVSAAVYGGGSGGTFTPVFTLGGSTPSNIVEVSDSYTGSRGRMSTVAANRPTDTYVIDLGDTGTISGLASMWIELTEA